LLASQDDIESVANGALGAMERSCHLKQRRGPGALLSQPAAQRLPRDIRALTVAEPDHIDQGALGRVLTDGQPITDSDHLPADREGVFGKDMKFCGRLK